MGSFCLECSAPPHESKSDLLAQTIAAFRESMRVADDQRLRRAPQAKKSDDPERRGKKQLREEDDSPKVSKVCICNNGNNLTSFADYSRFTSGSYFFHAGLVPMAYQL